MAFTRFVRRRRFSFLKLFLICFAFLGVFLLLYMRSNSIEKNLTVNQAKGSLDYKQAGVKKIPTDKATAKIAKFSIFVTQRSSVFRNPALLHKLQAKSPKALLNPLVKIGDRHSAHKIATAKDNLNFSIPQLKVTPGLGENGVPVILPKEEQILADKVFNEAAFNVYLSDRISLNRSVPDSRNPKCEYEFYDRDLPTASVVIIFTNEIWSTLLRTIHSVINRTPPRLLHEIILVDDFSDRDDLKNSLKPYISQQFKPNFIKLIRFNERQGLIRARLAGARLATGDVLVFLDSHCEANVKWLEPLVQRIKEKKSAVVCPIIDVVDDKTFEYFATNLEYFQIGGFTWDGHFNWIDIPEREEKRKKSEIAPTRTPTMAGGLFAIDREYFWKIGSYDSGMEIWGGENLEMSFRIWMCGGTLEIVPCSHVGHIFRSFHPYKFPDQKDNHGINTVRTVEVWMDNYRRYFYYNRPDLKNIDFGDITERLHLRRQLQCKSFEWYLNEIYPEKFIFDKGVAAYGSVKNPITELCLDTLNREEDKQEPLGYFNCKVFPGIVMNQMMSYTEEGTLRIESNCAEVDVVDNQPELTVRMKTCQKDADDQKWSHKMGGVFKHVSTGKCLDVRGSKSGDTAVVSECVGGHTQIWWFEHYIHPVVEVRNVIMPEMKPPKRHFN